jgi:hypothetical protein
MRIELAGRSPLLRRETPVHHADHRGALVLDARNLTFASPLELTAMTALAHHGATRGATTSVLPPVDPSVTSYLERMDVFASLPGGCEAWGDVPEQVRMDRSDALIEVLPVAAGFEHVLVDRVGRLAFTHLEAGIRHLAFQGIGELIDNAISHGASEIGAFAAAQTYTGATTGRRGLEFAICDTGIGILDHLRGKPRYRYRYLRSASSALRQALRPGVTGTRDKRGNGLADLFKITEGGGYVRLVLRSGDGLASVVARQHDQRRHYITTADPIPGTWAWLRVRYP